MERNSKIILCKNIKLDKNYNNVLNYTEQQMLALVNANKVVESNSYSFIRPNGTIKTQFPYGTCLQCNYMAFQNPDYSNKWFFAWIDDVVYKSDGCGEISFTIDIFSTWFNKVNIQDCFVVREHVNDDTIGLHTIPEGLDCGDYVVGEHLVDDLNRNTQNEPYCIVVASTVSFENDDKVFMAKYNGIPTGVRYGYWHINDINSVEAVVRRIESLHQGAIKEMFIAPLWLAQSIDDYNPSSETHPDYHTNNPAYEDISFGPLTDIDGYVPKNNKLFTSPYYVIQLSNAQGSDSILKNELWQKVNGEFIIRLLGCLTQGCSIRAIPQNYDKDLHNSENGINLGKFPQISWSSDAFTNWLTQNGVNVASSLLGAGITIATGNVVAGGLTKVATQNLLSKNVSKATELNEMKDTINNNLQVSSSSINVASSMASGVSEYLVPPSVHGNINNGDLMTADGLNCLHIYQKTIKHEYAKIIDDYFTKCGYKVNALKHPNITGRAIFNYVEIAGSENIGNGELPINALETINNAFKKGVTIWHNHANIGNYSLDNSIVQ